MISRRRTSDIQPLPDYGFFGPDSVTWKVFSYPTSMTVGFQRTVTTEMFEPFLMASVSDTDAVMKRPAARFDRTLQYVATVAFGDTASVLKASDVLVRIHSRIVGREPISGGTYDANDPQSQLWIHLTQWHSVLYCYEVYGPGKLTENEEVQYWAECALAAEFQTIDPADVPRNREEMRAYYARMRPVLAATEVAQQHVEHTLNAADNLLGDAPWFLRPLGPLVKAMFRKATIATLPRWLRRMAGVRQSQLEDFLVIGLMRPFFAMVHRSPRLAVKILEQSSPSTVSIVGPALFGLEPTTSVLSTPAEARALAGLRSPREQYAEQLAHREAIPAAAAKDSDSELLAFN